MENPSEENSSNTADERRKRILECAFDVVLRYGYQRMTMDDVAKACGMSRPALYLQFKNKGDIFSAIAHEMMGRSLESARVELERAGTIEDRLYSAIKVGILDPVEMLHSTAHGAELMDMKHQLAGDAFLEWRAKKIALVAAALEASGIQKSKGLNSEQLANVLLDGIDGLKMRAKSAQERADGASALVRLVAGS